MELRPVPIHVIADGIKESFHNVLPIYNTASKWNISRFGTPEVVKLGEAYVCTQCCGVLHYGYVPANDQVFQHHRCNQTYTLTNSPLLKYVKTSRITRHLFDSTVIQFEQGIRNVLTNKSVAPFSEDIDLPYFLQSQITKDDDDFKTGNSKLDYWDWKSSQSPVLTSSDEIDTEFWKKPFIQHYINDQPVTVCQRMRYLVRVMAKVIDERGFINGLILPCDYKLHSSARTANLGMSAYEFSNYTGVKPVDMLMRSFIYPTIKKTDTNYVDWIEGTSAVEHLKLTPSLISPLAGNLVVRVPGYEVGGECMEVSYPISKRVAQYGNILRDMMLGWPTGQVKIVCPNGVLKHQSSMFAQLHTIIDEGMKDECRQLGDAAQKGKATVSHRGYIYVGQSAP